MSGYGIMSSVWGMILQRGSTKTWATNLSVATKNRRDMTEQLLKAKFNKNKQINLPVYYLGYHFDIKANFKIFG